MKNTFAICSFVVLSALVVGAETPRWRGGTTLYGCEQPYGTTSFRRDLANNSYCNPCAPLLVSDDGEYVWSDEPFSFSVSNGTLFVSEERAPIERRKAGSTLREAYLAALQAHFPPSGRVPEEAFFVKPQYNTWIESCLTTNNRAMVEGYLAGIVTNRMPCGVLMLDDGWATVPGDLEFDERKFPDAKSMFSAIRAQGIRTMVWLTPYVNATSRFYRENVGSPLFYKNVGTGKDALFTFYPGLPEAACFDLTKRENRPILRVRYEAFCARYGIDGFKFDFTDAECLLRHKTPQRGLPRNAVPVSATEAWGDFAADSFPFHELRAGWKFGGKPLVVRLQDKCHTWNDLCQVIPDMIAAGLVGCPFVCPDMIGGGCGAGFDRFDRKLFVRSCEVQALMPMMQFSCAPWRVLATPELAICREMSELHVRTAPYILACARDAAKTGEPIVRAMEYAFPHQGFAFCRQQYMLGEKLLVAPVVSADDSVTVRLPAGRWRDDLGELHVGPKALELKDVPLARLPHYWRL